MKETEVKDRLFVSIAVSKPLGGLDELPGAITAAERMEEWALMHGYKTLLVNDVRCKEITTELLREKISEAINEITEQVALKRLVIYFAGHGFAQGIGDQYWVLTNWQKRPTEAISVVALQRMLEYYGPKQVAIIGDACQEFSNSFIDVRGSAVLDRPDETPRRYELDQFFAVDVGKSAFMIRAKGYEKAFCLFTEVLLGALNGDANDSYCETIGNNKVVTSQSLASYLDNTVSRKAAEYGLRMEPCPKPGFYTDRVYLSIPEPRLGVSVSSVYKNNDFAVSEVRHVYSYDEEIKPKDASNNPPSITKVDLISPIFKKAEFVGEMQEINNVLRKKERDLSYSISGSLLKNPTNIDCGIVANGFRVKDFAASFGFLSHKNDQKKYFELELDIPNDGKFIGWSDVLLTLGDKSILPICAINGFVTHIQILSTGERTMLHVPPGADYYRNKSAFDLLAQLHCGTLSDDQIIESALNLRSKKHDIITLGCIVAQFYDALRDVESLCSMASFYAEHNQPVPLDIVLFGGGIISEYGGKLYADIPAVSERKPRTENEARKAFSYQATSALRRQPIAGRIPWLGQAWGAIETAQVEPSAASWREKALEAMSYMTPGLFAAVRPEGRSAIFKLAGIVVEEPKPFVKTKHLNRRS